MTKKKSFLEKWGLVEAEEEFNQDELMESLQMQSQEIENNITYSQVPQTDIQFEDCEDFLDVPDVYEKFGIADLNKSIFKVEEFGNHLPDNLPSDVKRQSVIGILTASGLEVEDLLEDAEKRIEALKEVAVKTTENSNQVVIEKEEEIAELLNRIDNLKQDVIDRKKLQEKQDTILDEELVKISQILKFISSK